MKILDKIKDLLHIEHHPAFTTRIVETESDEYLVQIWDTEPLGLIHHWQSRAYRFDYKEIRSKSLPYVQEEMKKLDEHIQKYLMQNKIKRVVE